jgi:hypothetical protein
MSLEKTLISAPVHAVVSTPRMAMADCSLHDKDSRMCMATVISGEFEGEDVGVMVQYQDGFCICDMGDDNPMEILRIEQLRLWIPVRSVSVSESGVVTYDPL